MVSRVISIIALLVLVVLFGLLFYQVMAGFLMPLFLAVLAAVIFDPLFSWLLPKCRNSSTLAAGLTTLIVGLLIVVPFVPLAYRGIAQSIDVIENYKSWQDKSAETMQASMEWVNKKFSLNWDDDKLKEQTEYASERTWEEIKKWLVVLSGQSQYVLHLLIDFFIMLAALYYFFADGEDMLKAIGQLLPLDSLYQRKLLSEFAQVSRAVALATLFSCAAQGILLGLGFFFADMSSIALLVIGTMFASLLPIVGSTLIWVPCCLYIGMVEHRTMAAVLLTIWCVIMSTLVDNFLKPFILQGRTKLHPLLALLSVLGGVTALGPAGIFIGPMAVVFLQAALTMLQQELYRATLDASEKSSNVEARPAPAISSEANQAVATSEPFVEA
jgi:predicted PurR-regulated permease PerM